MRARKAQNLSNTIWYHRATNGAPRRTRRAGHILQSTRPTPPRAVVSPVEQTNSPRLLSSAPIDSPLHPPIVPWVLVLILSLSPRFLVARMGGRIDSESQRMSAKGDLHFRLGVLHFGRRVLHFQPRSFALSIPSFALSRNRVLHFRGLSFALSPPQEFGPLRGCAAAPVCRGEKQNRHRARIR